MRLAGILSALSFVALFASCAPTAVGDKCLQDSGCGVGFVCNHKIDCTSDDECIKGFVCNSQGAGAGSLCQQDENEDGVIGQGEDNTNTPEGVCAEVVCDETTICPTGFSCSIVAPATEGVCAKDAQ